MSSELNRNSDRALIIMAHGSRRDSANQEFFELIKRIDQREKKYACVLPALLEQAPPTLLQVAAELPEAISVIDVYPLFFNCGRHVEKDIPMQVSELMEQYPHKQVRLLDYFGQSPGLADLILNHVEQQR